ncbi:alpha/beta-hydrolase [Sarocladium strictum]
MILGPVSLIDCLVFCIFLAPQLILQVGIFSTVLTTLQCLPFLLLRLPYEFIKERYFTPRPSQSRFVQDATSFEDLVIRCVRYAFANIPASVGRVFFSKRVALPFVRWRMLRHKYLWYPMDVEEVTIGQGSSRTDGIWLRQDPDKTPDVVFYYVHGGGFAMGSSYFYLEFLMALHHLLLEAGYTNPAVFALEYTLVPDDIYPRQINQTVQGYRHVLEAAGDASRVCVGGDSAGATLVLSLLLELGAQSRKGKNSGGLAVPQSIPRLPLPRKVVLISPWVTLLSLRHHESDVDFLDRSTLWRYAHAYAGEAMVLQAPASPGSCTADELWHASQPKDGWLVAFGDQEVFAGDALDFIRKQRKLGHEVRVHKVAGGVHAWPVASLFLSSTIEKRLLGLRTIVEEVRNSNGTRVEKGKA